MLKLRWSKLLIVCILSLCFCFPTSIQRCEGLQRQQNQQNHVSGDYIYTVEKGGAVIQEYTGHELHCQIPQLLDVYPVVGIGDSAFYNKRFLRSLSMPDTIEWIGSEAFDSCDLLREICWSENLCSVGDAAFADCFSLEKVHLPESLKVIPFGMFVRCTHLKEVTCASDVTSIGEQAFWGCSRLKDFVFPTALTELGEMAFKECESLKRIILPDGIKEIKYEAFMECTRLKTVQLPRQLEEIGEGAFAQCWSLNAIRIPDSVEYISEMAFNGCRSRMVLIGKEGSAAQQYCSEERNEDVAFQNADTGEITPCKHPILHDLFFGINLWGGKIITLPILFYGYLVHFFVR